MPVTLEEIQEKHPSALYAPDPECERCGGAGETFRNMKGEFIVPHWSPCVCVFIGDKKLRERVVKTIRKMVQEYLDTDGIPLDKDENPEL